MREYYQVGLSNNLRKGVFAGRPVHSSKNVKLYRPYPPSFLMSGLLGFQFLLLVCLLTSVARGMDIEDGISHRFEIREVTELPVRIPKEFNEEEKKAAEEKKANEKNEAPEAKKEERGHRGRARNRVADLEKCLRVQGKGVAPAGDA